MGQLTGKKANRANCINSLLERGDGNRTLAEVPRKAVSFIVRSSLLRILQDNLLAKFANGPASEGYFAAQRLTRSAIVKAKGKNQKTTGLP
jgi:hypothetical protein